jgi:hypothetical protein
MSKIALSANILIVCITLGATFVISTGSGSFSIAQGQANDTSLTPEQKDAICNPNNPLSKLNPVNTTESKICGIPVTVKPHPSNMTSATNTTAGTEAPPSATSIAPSAVPST